MSSILTNVAAMTALKSLQNTNKSMEMTQARISTGMQVAEASDNAAYWSIATTMRSDNSALGTVQDALGLGAAKVDVAYTGINATLKIVDEIKSKLVTASEPGVDRSKVQSDIKQLQSELKNIAETASFSGENWLSTDSSPTGYSAIREVVASFNRASDGSVSLATIEIDTSTIVLFDAAGDTDDGPGGATGLLDAEYDYAGDPVAAAEPADDAEEDAAADEPRYTIATLDITAEGVDGDVIAGMISNVDATVQKLTTAASDLGSAKKRINMQSEFVGDLMNAINRGVGKLVDADMTEESTRLQALQVQQQLGVQSLSIANGNAQTILALFQR